MPDLGSEVRCACEEGWLNPVRRGGRPEKRRASTDGGVVVRVLATGASWSSSTLAVMGIAELLLAGERAGIAFDQAVEAVDSAEVAAVLDLTTHADARMRVAVAQTLPLLTAGETPTNEVVQAAIDLSEDTDPQVRDWACYALGTQWRDVDTPAVRDALAARLADSDRDTRCEALVGLAYRLDPRALPLVRAALSRPDKDVSRLELVAAGALADPQLHELVLHHQSGWDDDDDPVPTADLVRRLTDPAGVGDGVLDGVAELYRRRAAGQPDGDAIHAWHVLDGMLDIAPRRAREFLELVAARLAGDQAAEGQLRTESALAQMAKPPA